jgi:hypothetical protein
MASHELGHNFGLNHKNPLLHPLNLMKDGTPNSFQEWNTVITNSQIRIINDNYGKLNSGPNTNGIGLPYINPNEPWSANLTNTNGRQRIINVNKLLKQ